MFLHNDKGLFGQIVTEVAEKTGNSEAIIEKDYYVTLFLKYLAQEEELLVFKGGTCLSKCFKLIARFSEDIDINLEDVRELSQSRRKLLKDRIIGVINNLGLVLMNPEKIKSGMDYNCYEVNYSALFVSASLKQYLIIEPVFRIGAFPTLKKSTASLIYDYLKENGYGDIIKKYDLEPFNVKVQALERTFVDKVFAICDYYLNGRTEAQSRHIYDLYKILPLMKLDDKMKAFVEEIRQAREGKHDCPSANKGVSLPNLLEKLIAEGTYKQDFQTRTALLLYETVTYEQVITAIRTIANWLKK
ncbi:MAG: nucleotidyl transferase AbiEii/AbiGii toxin family protein [Firmicutes bacterium]|nr:nucleotidyl transferase AbiEii/AbiGii toxin family protein [Bacillota bacterium]